MFLAMGVGAFGAGIFHLYHPRVLQGLPLPRRRLGDPRAATASRTSATWAACKKAPADHVLDVRSSPRSRSPASPVWPASSRRTRSCSRPSAHGHTVLWVVGVIDVAAHGVLHVPAGVPPFFGRAPPRAGGGAWPRGSRQRARPRRSRRSPARRPAADGAGADRPGDRLGAGRLLGVAAALGGHNSLGEWLRPSFTATSKAPAECNVPVALPGAPAGMTLAECAPGDAVPAMASTAATAAEQALPASALAGAQAPAGAEAGHEASAEDETALELIADGGVLAHRLHRHRPGAFLWLQNPQVPASLAAQFPGLRPHAAQQVLRRRDLRRRRRPPDPARLDRRAVEGHGRQGRRRRGQRSPATSVARRQRGAAPVPDRVRRAATPTSTFVGVVLVLGYSSWRS